MSDHQIVQVRESNDTGWTIWKCSCGYFVDRYGDLDEARTAAAAHQLPDPVRQRLEQSMQAVTVANWCAVVNAAALEAYADAPDAWRWYIDTSRRRTPRIERSAR